MKTWPTSSLGLILAIILGASSLAAERSPVQNALETVFNVQRAPAKKTMGLLQRSFLDLVAESQPKLEIAFVIDGTTSMGESLAGVRNALTQMTDDLSLFKDGQLSFQLIIFRDAGAESGAVSMPLQVPGQGFTADREALKEALGGVQAESGAPYFPEQVDLGVHKALTELQWSKDADTSKWLFLFTDAPPFDPNFTEPENRAQRRFDTQTLVDIAREQGIRINTVLCTSREEDRQAYERGLDQTRQFLNQLTNGTEGVMLDLSYPDIRRVLEQAAQKPVAPQVHIGTISKQEIEAARQQATEQKLPVASEIRLKLAILPHGDLKQKDVRPSEPAAQVATELRETWRRAGAEVKNPRAIKDALLRLSRPDLEGPALLQLLGTVLDVDFVVWGDIQTQQGVTRLNSAFFDRTNGKIVLEASQAENAQVALGQLSGRVTKKMIDQALAKRQQLDQRLVAVMAAVRERPALESGLLIPVAGDAAERSHVLAGLHQLESALSYIAGNPESIPLLISARDSLEKAVRAEEDRRNMWAQTLLASCYYNLAYAYQQQGDGAAAAEALVRYQTALVPAYVNRAKLPIASMREEIAADYALLQKKDYAAAIKAYEALAGLKEDPNPNTALRAHWMLVGIYAGDWQVPPEFVDVEKVRAHLSQILAHWPDSPEAKFYAAFLQPDAREGSTRNPHLPLTHQITSEGGVTAAANPGAIP